MAVVRQISLCEHRLGYSNVHRGCFVPSSVLGAGDTEVDTLALGQPSLGQGANGHNRTRSTLSVVTTG